MIYNNIIDHTAFLIGSDGVTNRIPFDSKVGSQFDNIICIGRNVPISSSITIDNLYISPEGRLIVVETDPCRNAISQLLDYAKELTKWDCEKLDQICGDYYYKRDGQASRIIDLLARYGYATFDDAGRVTDKINRALSTSDFLLLIVGDGIRTNVWHTDSCADSDSSQKPSLLSRKDFISKFSDLGGYDADEITEFVLEMESVNGIAIKVTTTELQFRFRLEDGSSYSLMSFSIFCDHADLCIKPKRLNSYLEKHGHFPVESEDFLDFFKPFVDKNRCKLPPYEHAGSYFAIVPEVLSHQSDFSRALNDFVQQLS